MAKLCRALALCVSLSPSHCIRQFRRTLQSKVGFAFYTCGRPVEMSEFEKVIAEYESSTHEEERFRYHDVLAARLVQVFSVCIDTDYGRPCQVYGSIRATRGIRTSLYLYDRDVAHPETIEKYGSLSLVGQHDINRSAILGSERVTIDVCLKDRTRDIVLVKGQHNVTDPMIQGIEDTYDKLTKAVIQGDHCFAYLYYITFRFAVLAAVEVRLEKSDKSCSFADVYGSLVACYGNETRYCSNDDERKYLETILFEKPWVQPIRVIVGTPIKLLRSVVAIPAYSSLIIRADLYESRDKFVIGYEEFPVNGGGDTKSIQSENGCVQIEVTILPAYRQIYEEKKLEGRAIRGASENAQPRESNSVEPSKKAQVVPYQQLRSSNLVGGVPQIVDGLRICGISQAEVFSVYIGGINGEVSAICGTIKVYDGASFCIYNRDYNDPEVLPDVKIASIEVNKAILDAEFSVSLDLKDPVQNLDVCRGYICWCAESLENTYSLRWYNKRICSVVQGADGYAALHYMIFYDAVTATVEVAFFCDNFAGAPTNLYGMLCTSYGGHKYSTDYEKKYYRSRLFNRPHTKPVLLSTGSRVPLSKLVVAVPTNSFLVVEVDLRAICNDNSHEEALYGTLEFMIDLSCAGCMQVRGEFCRLEVSVKFEDPSRKP